MMTPTAEDGVTLLDPESNFSRYEEKFWALRGKLSAGRVSREEFNSGISKLRVRDQHGRLWRIHPEEGIWLLFKDDQWIEADPYAIVSDAATSVNERAIDTVNQDAAASIVPQCEPGEQGNSLPDPEIPTNSFQDLQEQQAAQQALADLPRAAAPPGTCGACGTVNKEGNKFCVKCGARLTSESVSSPTRTNSESETRVRLTFDSEPLSPPSSGGVRHVFGGVKPVSPTDNPEVQRPAQAEALTHAGKPQKHKPEKTEPPLPPSDQTWAFQDKLTEIAAKILATLEQSGLSSRTGLAGMLNRMIRATLLDKTIYREVAANASLQNEAWQVMLLVVILASSGVLLSSIQHLSASLLYSIIPSAVLQIAAILTRIWVTQAVASSWIKTPTHFNQFFRALVYAQSPVSLQIVPVVGQLIGLWSMITSTAAIRDVTGCSTKNAAILAVVSIAGAMVAVSLASPFVYTLLARL